ncbi:hypothetical protein FQN52_003808 [Onygenales sp. PD_12]|nr:hypothetical protein FQN52_003808 [Onygenales sp. PD_12]
MSSRWWSILMKTADKAPARIFYSIDHSFHDMFTQQANMQTLHDATDKEAHYSCGVDVLFDAGTPCKTGGELQTRNMRHDLLSFHPDAAMAINDGHNFIPGYNYSQFGDPCPDLTVVFQDSKDTGIYTSSPTSSTRKAYKNSPSATNRVRHQELNSHRRSIQKQNHQLDQMHSSIHTSSTMAYQHPWPNRFQNFNIHASDDRSALSSSSLRFDQHDGMPRLVGHVDALPNHHSISNPRYEFNPQQPAPVSPPTSDHTLRTTYMDQHTSTAPSSPSHSPPTHILRSQTSEDSSMSSWNTEPTDTTTFHYSPELQTHDSQTWWSPSPVPNRELQSYSQSTYPPLVMAPVPQRPNHPTRVLQNGLVMHLDQSSHMSSVMDTPLPNTTVSCADHMGLTSYPSLTPARDQRPHTSPFEDSNQRQCTPPSHAHSVSPANIGSPGMPLRATSTNPTHRSPKTKQQLSLHYQQQQQHRRSHIRKPSHLSGNSMRGTKPTPITPNNTPNPIGKAPMSVSFVNFTPEDSQKLLTGVAPSGSSKTKARREQEAREKRRKLSEAALLAVRRAGGDVEALEAVFC